MNGEGQVQIDRGHWRYRFALDADNIAIYRSQRTGQGLVPVDAWRSLASLGVSDAFVVPVAGGWQPFIEVGDGRQRWALQRRPTLGEAEATTAHFLVSLADAVAHISSQLGGEKDSDMRAAVALESPVPPAEERAAEAAFEQACVEREAAGWELIYSRQRAAR